MLAFGLRFSINFASEASVEAAPVNPLHDFPAPPKDDGRPITVRVEYSIADGNRQRFSDLMQDVQAAHRRNGAFHCWLDEWLEFIAFTWAKHLRQGMRNDCRRKESTGCGLGPAQRRLGTGRPPYLATRRSVRLHGYGFFGRTFGDTSNWSRPGLAPCDVIHGSVTDSLSDSCGGRELSHAERDSRSWLRGSSAAFQNAPPRENFLLVAAPRGS